MLILRSTTNTNRPHIFDSSPKKWRQKRRRIISRKGRKIVLFTVFDPHRAGDCVPEGKDTGKWYPCHRERQRGEKVAMRSGSGTMKGGKRGKKQVGAHNEARRGGFNERGLDGSSNLSIVKVCLPPLRLKRWVKKD